MNMVFVPLSGLASVNNIIIRIYRNDILQIVFVPLSGLASVNLEY